jgi:16S rRNA (guanine966-N2)-methyltransferase
VQRARNIVRIIGGALKRRQICFPDLPEIRPTPDRARETLFNWLAPSIIHSRCLDLFSGSGALSFEALSRGAATVICVEHSRLICNHLEEYKQLFNPPDSHSHSDPKSDPKTVLNIIHQDAVSFLKSQSQNTLKCKPFDIVFVDPPFDHNLWFDCCLALHEQGWITPESVVYLETPHPVPKDTYPTQYFKIYKETAMGQVHLTLLIAQ